jgi:hypothetical protein
MPLDSQCGSSGSLFRGHLRFLLVTVPLKQILFSISSVSPATQLSTITSYCHFYEWPYTGFRLVNRFIETYRSSLQVTTALSLIHTLCSSLQHVLNLLGLLCLHQWTFLCSRAYVLAGSRPTHINFLLFSLPSKDSSVMAAGPHYIAWSRNSQKTQLRVTQPLANNGFFIWLHSSCFEQICHSIYCRKAVFVPVVFLIWGIKVIVLTFS